MEEEGEVPQSPTTLTKTSAAKRGAKGKVQGSSSGATTPPTTRAATRQTRSQAAPEWSVQETLVLVSEIAALDEDWLKAFSSYQKWKMIADNCMVRDVVRSSSQCKRRWESLLADYTMIRNWESRSALSFGSYWSLPASKKKQHKLPAGFDDQVFGSMDAVIRAQEAQITSDSEELMGGLDEGAKEEEEEEEEEEEGDATEYVEEMQEDEAEGSDSDSDVALPLAENEPETVAGSPNMEMVDAQVNADSGAEKPRPKDSKETSQVQEMAIELRKSAEQIQSILRGELPENVSQRRAPVDLTRPNAPEIDFTRCQADELIKVYVMLNETLNKFNELIKESGSDGIRLNSKPS